MPKVFTPRSARKHRAKSPDTMFLMASFREPSVLLGFQLSKTPLGWTDKMAKLYHMHDTMAVR